MRHISSTSRSGFNRLTVFARLCGVLAIAGFGGAAEVASAAPAGTAPKAPVYRIEAIEKHSGIKPTEANAISSNGTVAGGAKYNPNGGLGSVGFLLRGDKMEILDTEQSNTRGPHLGAEGVNDAGVTVGTIGSVARMWTEDGQVTNLNDLVTDCKTMKSSWGVDINEAGDVVFNAICAVTHRRDAENAYIYRGGVLTRLGDFGPVVTVAYDINRHGQVVGYARGVNGDSGRALLWENGVARDLGTLGGEGGVAQAINDLGHVAGGADDASNTRRNFFYDGTAMTALPTCDKKLTMEVHAINNRDQIVGDYHFIRGRAALIQGGRCHYLEDLFDASGAGWEHVSARDIDDRGVIVGSGLINGENRAFVATPVSP